MSSSAKPPEYPRMMRTYVKALTAEYLGPPVPVGSMELKTIWGYKTNSVAPLGGGDPGKIGAEVEVFLNITDFAKVSCVVAIVLSGTKEQCDETLKAWNESRKLAPLLAGSIIYSGMMASYPLICLVCEKMGAPFPLPQIPGLETRKLEETDRTPKEK